MSDRASMVLSLVTSRGQCGSGSSLALFFVFFSGWRASHAACSALPFLIALVVAFLDRPEGGPDHFGAAGADVLDDAGPDPRAAAATVKSCSFDRMLQASLIDVQHAASTCAAIGQGSTLSRSASPMT